MASRKVCSGMLFRSTSCHPEAQPKDLDWRRDPSLALRVTVKYEYTRIVVAKRIAIVNLQAVIWLSTSFAAGQGDDSANSAAFSTSWRASCSMVSSNLLVIAFLLFSARATRAMGSLFFHSASCDNSRYF